LLSWPAQTSGVFGSRTFRIALLALTIGAAASAAEAGAWTKIMQVDPFQGKDGTAHFFDRETAFQDRSTGWVVARLIYASPTVATSGEVKTWYLWAFDCRANAMRSIGYQGEDGFKANDGWRDKPESLAQSQMGGVTNELEHQLCAFDGLWPKGDISN
jgi:hypothetical protein